MSPGGGWEGWERQAAPGLRSLQALQRAGAAGRDWVTPGAWAAPVANPVPPSPCQPTLRRERPSSLSQSAPRREEAAPGDWGHFVLAGARVTRWRPRRSDGFPPGRSRRQWWQRYRPPSFTAPLSQPATSPRPRKKISGGRPRTTSGRASAAATTLHEPRPGPSASAAAAIRLLSAACAPRDADRALGLGCPPRFSLLPRVEQPRRLPSSS